MSATGIGASVRRKEDFRFITGKGHYTDDINRPGQAYAYFLRSPHAHAKINRIDASAAQALPSVTVLTGAGPAGRQDRQPDLRLDDPFQGRLADEDGAASGARGRQGVLRRRPGRGRDRRYAGAGEGRRREGRRRLRGAARRRRSAPRPRTARRSTRSRRRTRSTNGTWATRPRPMRPSRTPSTSPSSTSPTTAWCRMRSSRASRSANTTPAPRPSRSGTPARTRMSRGSSSPPSSAWRPSTSCA